MASNSALPCSNFPVRKGKVSTFEWAAAELYMQCAYNSSFYEKHTSPSLALALSAGPRFVDSSYFAYMFRATDPSLCMALQVCLKYLLRDFRNPLSQTRVQEFERAFKQGRLTWELVQDLIQLIKFPGGMRKPDILGIVAERDPGLFELHEVCTEGTLAETKKEATSKLTQLRTQVIPFVIKELAERQSALRESGAPLIHRFDATPSGWAPPRELRACPLGVSFDGQRNATKVTWACFEPAVEVDVAAIALDGPPKLVTPGILPYHIHEVEGPYLNALLPMAVRLDLKRWEGELARSRGLVPLQLLPEANPVLRRELGGGFNEEGRRILAYGSVGVAAVLFCIVAAPILADVLAGAAALDLSAMAVGATVARMRAAIPTIRALSGLASDYAISLSRAAVAANGGVR